MQGRSWTLTILPAGGAPRWEVGTRTGRAEGAQEQPRALPAWHRLEPRPGKRPQRPGRARRARWLPSIRSPSALVKPLRACGRVSQVGTPRSGEDAAAPAGSHLRGVGPAGPKAKFCLHAERAGRCGDRGRGGEPGAWHAEAGPREPGGPAGVLSPGSPAAGKAARCAVVLGAGSPPTRFQDPEQQATRLRPRGRGPRRHRPLSPPPLRQLRQAAGPGHPGDAQVPGGSSLPAALATRGAGGAHGRGSAGTRRREPSADV